MDYDPDGSGEEPARKIAAWNAVKKGLVTPTGQPEYVTNFAEKQADFAARMGALKVGAPKYQAPDRNKPWYSMTEDEIFDEFARLNRPSLYGAYSDFQGQHGVTPISTWEGAPVNYQGGSRGSQAMANANLAMPLVDAMFPNTPQGERDRAAYKATQARGYQFYWGAPGQVLANEVADNLPGIPRNQKVTDYINQTSAGAWNNKVAAKKSIHKAEDAASKADFMQIASLAAGFAVPGLGSLFTPSLGMIGGRALAGGLIGGGTAAIGGGNIGRGILGGAVSGGIGGYASGLEGGANFVGPTQGNFFTPSSLVNAGGQFAGGMIGGQPFNKAALGAVGSVVGTGVSRMAQTSLNQNGFSPSIARAGGTLAGGLSSGMIKGNSFRDALISSGIAAGGSLIGSNYGKEGKGLYDAATKLAMNQYRASQSPVRRVAPMQPRPMISQQPSGPSKQQIMAAMNQMTPAQRQALMARMRGA